MNTIQTQAITEELNKFNMQDQFVPPDELKDDNNNSQYSIRLWWSVLQANKFKGYKDRVDLYERSLKYLPGCFKIWFNYLNECMDNLNKVTILSQKYKQINQLFERSLKYMEKMPQIWLMYTEFLIKQRLITATRLVFDRALRSLPATQHEIIWRSYTLWTINQDSLETTKHVLNRYILIDPDYKEQYLKYLLDKDDYNEATLVLNNILKDDGFVSQEGHSKFQFYIDLCDIICQKPGQITNVDCEQIIREGISKYVDEVGNLWVRLANYYIIQGKFERGRQVFDEALQKILTTRDFGIVYNAYLKFEEELVNAFSQAGENDEINEDDIEEQITRIERLIEKRPFLLNEVQLRFNPNNVNEWLQKLKLYQNNKIKCLNIFAEAINKISPEEAINGSLSDIWIRFAMFYKEHEDLLNANLIFHKATSEVVFKTLDDTVNTWVSWIEMLLEVKYYNDALVVVKQALFNKKNQESKYNLSFNLTLWSLYIDIERNIGTFETIKAAYRKMLDMKVITPFILLNFAKFYEDNHYYEDSFKIYEFGISLFKWPALYEIWLVYIEKFIERYGGEKLERVRDMFEKVLQQVPQQHCKIFYLMYANFEETYGLLNHSFEVYDRMVACVEDKDKMHAYNLYICKISTFLGITRSRPIFENAIENLKGDDIVRTGLRFAHLERRLNEIDRARAIYIHISQFTDPADDDLGLWKIWDEFEIHHGNEETYKEFMRIKRSVLQKFNLMPPDPDKIKSKVEKGEL